MNALMKWQLNQALSREEAISIIEELYSGSSKEFVFNTDTKIDTVLYSIYESFPSTQSDFVLRFSSVVCEIPFVSLNIFPDLNPHHTIRSDEHTIFIYEKK
jgi:hypothetical protein